MKSRKTLKKAMSYAMILGMAVLCALSFELFIFPNDFAPSGLGGICTMIQYVFGIRVSFLNMVLNIPLALMVYFKVSKPMALRSMVFNIGLSGGLAIFDMLPIEVFAYSTDTGTSTILGPIVAGLITGFCGAMVVRAGSYTGGLDFVAALVRKKNPEMNFYTLTFAFNCMVAVASYFVYDYELEPVLLCILYSYLASSVSDKILKSGKSAIKFEIVTDCPEELSRALMARLHHTITQVKGRGMYSGKEVSILMCVINRVQIAELENILADFPGTFAYLSPVNAVVGQFLRFDKNGRQEQSMLDGNLESKM